jgi:hypothetical protein
VSCFAPSRGRHTAPLKEIAMHSRSIGNWLQLAGTIVLSASVGAVVGALVALNWGDSPPPSRPLPRTAEHLEAISMLSRAEWPRVEYSGEWYNSLYNTQTALEYEWSDLSDRIHADGIDLVRTKVEDWRVRYADWVEEVDERLSRLERSDPHYESVEAIHARGQRVLRHVDAIFDR